jgi:transposase-like protein
VDSYAASHRAVRELKADRSLPANTKLPSSKYLSNLIEQDHCTKARCGTAPCPTVLASMLEDTAGHEIELLTGGSGMKRVLGPV